MTTTLSEQILTGTWTLDKVHSTVGYAVRHSGLSLFKGGLTDFDQAYLRSVYNGIPNLPAITKINGVNSQLRRAADDEEDE